MLSTCVIFAEFIKESEDAAEAGPRYRNSQTFEVADDVGVAAFFTFFGAMSMVWLETRMVQTEVNLYSRLRVRR